jgi:hypothetical protein
MAMMMRRRKLNVGDVGMDLYSHRIVIIHDDVGRHKLPFCSYVSASDLEAVTRPHTSDMPMEYGTCSFRKNIGKYDP